MEESSRFLPFLPDFPLFQDFLPDFRLLFPDFFPLFPFPDFWKIFRCQGARTMPYWLRHSFALQYVQKGRSPQKFPFNAVLMPFQYQY